MNARCVLMLLFVTVITPGCSALPDDPPEPVADCTTAPRAKTPTELLVGKWTVVEHNGRIPSPQWHMTYEFTADGRVSCSCHLDGINEAPATGSSTYRVEGQAIHIDPKPGDESVCETTINALTEDTLSLTHREVVSPKYRPDIHCVDHYVMKRVPDR